MKLVFLATRGEIGAHTRRHRRHTSLVVSYRGRRVVIDAGRDWLGSPGNLRPKAIVVAHAHPDHADGLRQRGLEARIDWEGMELILRSPAPRRRPSRGSPPPPGRRTP